jgi:hypothetical protein
VPNAAKPPGDPTARARATRSPGPPPRPGGRSRPELAADVRVRSWDPQSPRQREANGNTNRLLRQYFPRRTARDARRQAWAAPLANWTSVQTAETRSSKAVRSALGSPPMPPRPSSIPDPGARLNAPDRRRTQGGSLRDRPLPWRASGQAMDQNAGRAFPGGCGRCPVAVRKRSSARVEEALRRRVRISAGSPGRAAGRRSRCSRERGSSLQRVRSGRPRGCPAIADVEGRLLHRLPLDRETWIALFGEPDAPARADLRASRAASIYLIHRI